MHACVYVCVGSFTSGSKRYWVHGLGSYVVMTTDYINVTYPFPLPIPLPFSPPLPSPSPLSSPPFLLSFSPPSPFSPPLLSPHFLQCSCYVALDKMGSTGWNLKVELLSFNSIATCTYNMCTCVCVCVHVQQFRTSIHVCTLKTQVKYLIFFKH